ncbi:MAG TPA: AMP-binding protein [Candidatus Acidoferrales bacterium]|nr:AMP-binding protein [Candidatus Acidoferrales bacterium]
MPFYDQAIETAPRERLQTLQFQKLQKLLREISGRNRFYIKKWKDAGIVTPEIQSFSDFQKLPLTCKSELARAQEEAPPFGTNATYSVDAYTRVHQTSGTTGTPLRVVDTPESWEWWGECWAHVLKAAGVTWADRVFLAFSFGPFIGFWATVEGTRKIGAMVIPGGGWDSIQRLHMMRDLGATVVCCTPTYALRLAEVARAEHFDMRAMQVRTLIHAGEPGANVARTKSRIQKEWSAKCFDHAGASEVGAHSFECEVQPGGIHLLESEFIAEVLDPQTAKEVPSGEIGELVITNLGRAGFPAIRYRTGDLVRLNLAPCACGRTFARFDGGLLGRSDDMVTIRGVNVYPTAIENVIRQFASVDEFQVTVTTLHEMHHLEIQIEVVSGNDVEHVRTHVEQAIYHALSLHPTVKVAEAGSLTHFEMKARRFRRLDGASENQPG